MSDRIEIKRDGSWVFHGEDSRLKHSREDHQVTRRIWNPLTRRHEYQVLDKVFCMNCGADGGLSARTAVYVRYLCDDCYNKGDNYGFVPMAPDEEFRWRNGLKETA